jgi:23S rRNA (cytidine1920-2'-O)/16S rRNA (cytidine1409-2'-O)-methyltransferase
LGLRADQLVVDKGLARTRSQARSLIMAGMVRLGDQVVAKPGEMLPPDADIQLKVRREYVSRGGFKLEGALQDFQVDPTGMKVLDIGSSTGGFTDCLLKNGAASVTCVDVGYGVLDWSLRQDERVTVLERTNARYLTPEIAGSDYDLTVIDVSFISLTLVLPPIRTLLKPGGRVVALCKPQFEAGRGNVGKGGVVRDERVQIETVERVAAFARDIGFRVDDWRPSKLKGPKGNQEYFLFMTFSEA